jgi:hypothetical protein
LCLNLVSSVARSIPTSAYLSKLFGEGVDEVAKYFSSIVDLFSVFSNNPDQRSSCIGLVQFVDTLAKRGYNSFVAWVFAENVLDNHDGFLDHVVDFGVDKIKQRVNTLLAGTLDLDGHLPDGLDGSANEVHVYLHGILFQFCEQLIHVLVVRYPHHYLELLHLQVRRVIIFAEKDAHLLAENVCLFLEEKVDIS